MVRVLLPSRDGSIGYEGEVTPELGMGGGFNLTEKRANMHFGFVCCCFSRGGSTLTNISGTFPEDSKT